MCVGHRPFAETDVPNLRGRVGGTAELAGRLLDGDLPEGDRTQDDIRVTPKTIEEVGAEQRRPA